MVKKTSEKARGNCSKIADCAIINLWYGNVHGAILTAYALQNIIEELGYTVRLINTTPEAYADKRKGGISEEFEKEHLNSLPEVYTSENIKALNGKFNYFISGSDQVFRAEWIDDRYFLDFVRLNTPKIAIAASFGTDRFFAYKVRTKRIAFLLNRFNDISVREESGISICKTLSGARPDWIVDPVFITDKRTYEELTNKPNNVGNYIVCYLRDYDEAVVNCVKKVAEVNDVSLIFITDETSVCDFLSLIRYAKFVVTDSYHGLCFSFIFNTPVYCYYNELRGNARFDSLKKLFFDSNLYFVSDREADLTELQPIDQFDLINDRIRDVAAIGKDWIKVKLSNPTSLNYPKLIYRYVVYRIYCVLGFAYERIKK